MKVLDVVVKLECFISEAEKTEIVKYMILIADKPRTIKKMLDIVTYAMEGEQ